jgi:Ca2+-binding RTX toxin-like protein
MVFGEGGNDTFKSFGTLVGTRTLDGGAGNDTFYASSIDTDRLVGGADNDTYYVRQSNDIVVEAVGGGTSDRIYASFNYTMADNVEQLNLTGSATTGTGNAGSNIIFGNALANTLSGLGSADALLGQDGNDRLIGGAGNDKLVGGLGADTFVFGSALAADADNVEDFVRGTDKLQFTAAQYGLSAGALNAADLQLGASATTGSSQFLFNSANATLYWDANGVAGGEIRIATLKGLTTLAVSDFILV